MTCLLPVWCVGGAGGGFFPSKTRLWRKGREANNARKAVFCIKESLLFYLPLEEKEA